MKLRSDRSHDTSTFSFSGWKLSCGAVCRIIESGEQNHSSSACQLFSVSLWGHGVQSLIGPLLRVQAWLWGVRARFRLSGMTESPHKDGKYPKGSHRSDEPRLGSQSCCSSCCRANAELIAKVMTHSAVRRSWEIFPAVVKGCSSCTLREYFMFRAQHLQKLAWIKQTCCCNLELWLRFYFPKWIYVCHCKRGWNSSVMSVKGGRSVVAKSEPWRMFDVFT